MQHSMTKLMGPFDHGTNGPWTLRLIFDHPLKQWPAGRKRGKDRNTKNWISQDGKELFRWNKKYFS